MKFDVSTIETIFSLANAGIDLFNKIRSAAASSADGALTAEEIQIIVAGYTPRQDELDARFDATDNEENGDDGSDE